MDNALLKKASNFFAQEASDTNGTSFELMLAEKNNFTIIRMVRLLEVSRSGYYAWIDTIADADPAGTRRAKSRPSSTAIRTRSTGPQGSSPTPVHGRGDHLPQNCRHDHETLGFAGTCPKKWKTITIIDHADAYAVDAVKRKWDTGP